MTGIFLKWLGSFALCFALQTSLVPVISIGGVYPDLMVMLLFLLGIRTSVLPAVFAGFFAGLCQDVYTPAVLGQHALSMTITGAFAGVFNEKVMRTDFIFKFILLLFAFILHDTVFTIVSIVKTDAGWTLMFSELIMRTLPRALYSAGSAALIFIVSYYLNPPRKR
jgi:rod shape-determining protein MreD